MNYYDIAPATNEFRGKELLTYSSEASLKNGQIVLIKLRSKLINGFVVTERSKPSFKVNNIEKVLEDLIIPQAHLTLFGSMLEYYPSYLGATARLFAPSFLNENQKIIDKKQENKNLIKKLGELTSEQKSALNQINKYLKNQKTMLLHGETGSGKTRIYLELAKQAIESGKSVVILTPEISLTQPLFKIFDSEFDNVNIVHSNQTPKTRNQTWLKIIKSKKPNIIIGPRSSLFMPIKNIGLIVLDEFHDQSYKQDSAPYYSAVRSASMLVKNSDALLILGSATPPINDYYLIEQKNIPILRMTKQAASNSIKETKSIVVDLLDKSERSPYPLISNTLIKLINHELKNKNQSLIFINKRGTARMIACQECGWRAKCINCELPMVYHHDQHQLKCHTCGYHDNVKSSCPDCGSLNIQYKSPGTKQIVESLEKIFPHSKIIRFDKDNKKSERLENNYQQLVEGAADIIVGTQLVTKGHDLPKLGLVAMLQAETGLDFPDFSSDENSFQLIKQLSGRVGRGHTKGVVVLQTMAKSNPLIKFATENNWQEFYESQIQSRKKYGFPPFFHALKIEASRKTSASAKKSLDNLIAKINEMDLLNFEILGPSPNFIEKRSVNYNWQIIIKSKQRSTLTKISKNISGNFKIEIDPQNFL